MKRTVLYVPMAANSEYHSRGHLFADCPALTRARYHRHCPKCTAPTVTQGNPIFVVTCSGERCPWVGRPWRLQGRPAAQLHPDTYDLLFRDLCRFCERRAAKEAA